MSDHLRIGKSLRECVGCGNGKGLEAQLSWKGHNSLFSLPQLLVEFYPAATWGMKGLYPCCIFCSLYNTVLPEQPFRFFCLFIFKTSNLCKESEPFIGLKHPKTGGAASGKAEDGWIWIQLQCNMLHTSLQQLLILVNLKDSLRE